MPIDHQAAEKVLHELMSDRTDGVVDVALATRSAVHKAAKKAAQECCEMIYSGYCVSDAFSFTGKLGQGFIHIATYANHVNLGFNHGVDLPDPKNVLQGTGKAIRHVRVNAIADLKTKPVKDLINAAVAQGLEMAEEKGGIREAEFIFNKKKK